MHCKAVEQRATLIHRQYNRDWGTSYSRPPIDPYLTSHLLQNPGGATEWTCNATSFSVVQSQALEEHDTLANSHDTIAILWVT